MRVSGGSWDVAFATHLLALLLQSLRTHSGLPAGFPLAWPLQDVKLVLRVIWRKSGIPSTYPRYCSTKKVLDRRLKQGSTYILMRVRKYLDKHQTPS